MEYQFALVGVGKWGANFLRTLAKMPNYALSAIVSSQLPEQLNAIADIGKAKHFSDVDALLRAVAAKHIQVDGVIVSTPPQTHFAIIDKILDAGIPVLAEKPLTLTKHESLVLLEKARYKSLLLIEDFIHLFSWPYYEVYQRTRRASKLHIQACGTNHGPFRDYSPLWDYAPHDIAMAINMFDEAPFQVGVEKLKFNSPLAFTARITLLFSKGQADLEIGNVTQTKQRRFCVTDAANQWIYDDTAANKLIVQDENGRQIIIDGEPSLKSLSAIEIALKHFAGELMLYDNNKLHWLSGEVAKILEVLELQLEA